VTLDDVPREWLLAIAALAVIVLLWSWLRGVLRRASLRRRFDRAADGERFAAHLLESAGFAIEGAQVMGGYTLHLDGEPVGVEVRADYVVRRGSARYVAEVKTGPSATKITTPATRRQLLDYQHAFDVDGILLVDAEEERIHHVSLPPCGGRA
jgi:hypothetical protein